LTSTAPALAIARARSGWLNPRAWTTASPANRSAFFGSVSANRSASVCDEAAQVRISDLTLPQVPDLDLASVLIRGKGNETRRCPLWAQTVRELAPLVQGRAPGEHVFLNRSGRPITRFGIHTLVERCVARAVKHVTSLTTKRVSPHTIRHTTATYLLRAGVDIKTIRA
jgi:site-specific recombinase XerD